VIEQNPSARYNLRMSQPPTSTLPPGFLTYEEQLNRDWSWAMNEGGRHFEEDSKVFKALRRIARRLNQSEIPYAVVGGMAVFHYGLRRYTEDVDLLVTKENLKAIHEQLVGLGYYPPFAGSKHLRDAESGVKIKFLTTGDVPGDGKPKPVAFPDPRECSVVANGVKFIELPKLMEMKIASGMSGLGRSKDFGDAVELIKILGLAEGFADSLNPYVREKFAELWAASSAPGLSDTMPD